MSRQHRFKPSDPFLPFLAFLEHLTLSFYWYPNGDRLEAIHIENDWALDELIHHIDVALYIM